MDTSVPLTCPICPHRCRLASGETGRCRARQHVNGRITPLAFARPCSIALDPMEKKPLFHFFPGTPVLSLGMAGCNLQCRNCQNSGISQCNPLDIASHHLPPHALVPLMTEHGALSVAYTYTEPLVAFEYVLECAQRVKEANGHNVLVTAAFVQLEPLQQLLPFIDAVNVDIKSMNPAFYRENCGANLAPVLRNLHAFQKAHVILEITNLIIPTLNDTETECMQLIDCIKTELGCHVPVHFSRFFPSHELQYLPPTPEATLFYARDMALAQGLHHVYVGNMRGAESTFCAQCGTELITRQGYAVVHNALHLGQCPSCSTPLYGRF